MRLGDIATYVNGYAFKPSDWGNVGLPIIRIQDLTGSSYQLNYYNGEYPSKIEINNGDVLISWSASLGVYIWKGGKALLNQHIFKVVFDKVSINKQYFVYAVQYNLSIMASKMHGATMKHIVKKDFDNIEILYPDQKRQNEIVNILSKVDMIITAYKQQLTDFDILIKSRFIEMFGDPEINPHGWEQVVISDVCSSIVRGPFGSALKKEFFVEPDDKTYKVYEQKHAIQKSAIIGTYYVTEEKYKELKRFECFAGDILMSCSGTMGALYQLPEGCEKGIINQALCKFTLNEKILPVIFLTYMKQMIRKLETKGSGIQNIAAVSYIKSMPISLPPMEMQQEFSAFVQQIDKLKLIAKESLEKLEIMKEALMQQYFG